MVDRTEYRATTDIRGHTVVEANLPCINGLSAWVMVADLGKSQPEDEMFSGLDREGIAQRIVAALRPTAAAAALQQQPEPVAVVGSDWTLLWVGSQPIAHIVQRHPGLKVGSMLYTTPPAISGFMEAFYEMAAMLGVEGAQAKSPQQVYVEQIKPALESALQQQEVPREPVAHQISSPKIPDTLLGLYSAERVRAMLAASPSTTRQQEVGSGAQYRHKRTGGLYAVIGTAKLQTDKPLFDMAEVVTYRGEDGRVWVRAAAEFDERFERAAAPSTPENADGGPHG